MNQKFPNHFLITLYFCFIKPFKYTMMNKYSNDRVVSLIQAFQLGDSAAFSSLYDMHINILLNFGSKLTTDKELLKDCIQDVFIKLYSKKDELDVINNFKSYLFISLKNKIFDEYRKKMYISDTPVEETNLSSSSNLEQDYVIKEQTQMENLMVQRLLVQLSPRQREVLTLYYLEEKKYEDICIIMNMNYQSVRNLMHRSLTKLRSLVSC